MRGVPGPHLSNFRWRPRKGVIKIYPVNLSFLLLLAAAGLLRFLAEDAHKAFQRRLASSLPRSVTERHLQVFLREFHQHFGEFRRQTLPFSALQIALNAAACGLFVFAVWYAPPAMLPAWALAFLRYASVVVVPAAFVADAVGFARVLAATFTHPLSAGEPEP